jgi:hypothetical protein
MQYPKMYCSKLSSQQIRCVGGLKWGQILEEKVEEDLEEEINHNRTFFIIHIRAKIIEPLIYKA